MVIYVPKETCPGERRVAVIPDTVSRLVKKGAEIVVESGVGLSCGHSDEAYEKALHALRGAGCGIEERA